MYIDELGKLGNRDFYLWFGIGTIFTLGTEGIVYKIHQSLYFPCVSLVFPTHRFSVNVEIFCYHSKS